MPALAINYIMNSTRTSQSLLFGTGGAYTSGIACMSMRLVCETHHYELPEQNLCLIIILQVHVQLLVFSSYFAQQLPVCMNAMYKN